MKPTFADRALVNRKRKAPPLIELAYEFACGIGVGIACGLIVGWCLHQPKPPQNCGTVGSVETQKAEQPLMVVSDGQQLTITVKQIPTSATGTLDSQLMHVRIHDNQFIDAGVPCGELSGRAFVNYRITVDSKGLCHLVQGEQEPK